MSEEAWIREHVAVAGEIETVHVRPWSRVARVPTPDGPVWFKAPAPPVAHEAGVVEVLARRRPDLLPEVIALDLERGWLLLGDGGTRLREAPERDWPRILGDYARLQVEAAEDLEALLATGAPDRRLHLLPDGYLAAGGDPELLPRVRAACERVAALGLPDTIQHDDLHDGNVFFRDGRYLLFDWGDCCVSNPLLTLGVTLQFVDDERAALDAFLEPWTAFAPLGELDAAVPSARALDWICRALCWQRVADYAPPEVGEAHEDPVELRLEMLLATLP